MAMRSGDRAFTLSPRLDTAAARPLLEALRELKGQDVRLDAAGVEQIGGLCLQVLLAAASSWAKDGQALELCEPSAAMQAGLGLFGLKSLTHYIEGAAS